MYILLNDEIQNSNAGAPLKTPALSERYMITSPLTIKFNEYKQINAIGIGNADIQTEITDGFFSDVLYTNFYDGGSAGTVFSNIIDGLDAAAANITIKFNDRKNTIFKLKYTGNGLYLMPDTVYASTMTITTTAKYFGRIAAGIGVKIPTAVAKEPAFHSTNKPRTTLSGQVVQGLGGYNYKSISLDSRYKINQTAIEEIEKGYKYIGMGYPFFIDLSDEAYKLPFNKFYATENNQLKMSFEGGIRKYLYSRRWNFTEAF